MVSIKIDYREQELMKHCEFEYEQSNLSIGDIYLVFDEKYEILVERKTATDFWHSITDGRYREQRSRLLEWKNDSETRFIIYLIEGDDINSIEPVKCAIHRLVLLYHVSIWNTKNVYESSRYILWLRSQKTLFEKRSIHKDQIHSLSNEMKKKRMVQTPKNMLLAFLSAIPGISFEMAQELSKTSETIQEFFQYCIQSKSKAISNILYKTKSNNTRKFGKEKSKKLFEIMGLDAYDDLY